ncbi:hypothetical protein [Bacillus sp. SRB1LM]|uniref:hypothetical protein n=1 Tax=Bacillus sp. SRB1LM TaxID=2608688 RepID=UPI0018C37280|nr:hypothetical protein [Bacillus sp. SRB1LM]MBG0962461.1 hypothetical protein [Bacillus sp. SRB1LM]
MIEFLKSNIIPVTALSISIATFIITFKNFWRNRANIECIQLEKSMATLLKPDKIDTNTPDVYWDSDYRVIMDVIITNKSALPISIIEFSLNNTSKFNSYSKPSPEYTVTIQPGKQEKDGMVIHYAQEKKHIFPMEDSWLQPIIDIPPYTSLRGHLLFRFNDKSEVHIGNNTLEVITSRKTFSFQVKITKEFLSVIPLPDSVLIARDGDF